MHAKNASQSLPALALDMAKLKSLPLLYQPHLLSHKVYKLALAKFQ